MPWRRFYDSVVYQRTSSWRRGRAPTVRTTLHGRSDKKENNRVAYGTLPSCEGRARHPRGERLFVVSSWDISIIVAAGVLRSNIYQNLCLCSSSCIDETKSRNVVELMEVKPGTVRTRMDSFDCQRPMCGTKTCAAKLIFSSHFPVKIYILFTNFF
jgi:predicted secreted protein